MLPGIFKLYFFIIQGLTTNTVKFRLTLNHYPSAFNIFCDNISAVVNQSQLNYNLLGKMSCIMKIMEPETWLRLAAKPDDMILIPCDRIESVCMLYSDLPHSLCGMLEVSAHPLLQIINK